MKELSEELEAIFDLDHFAMCDLYTITLVNGEVVRLTTADKDIVSGENTFLSSGPLIERSSVSWRLGVEVDTLDMTIYPHVEMGLVNAAPIEPGDPVPVIDELVDKPWLEAVRNGYLDGATIQLDKAFLQTWDDATAESVPMFVGRVGEIESDRTKIVVKVNSLLEILSTEIPRQLFSPGCCLTLYDSDCGIDRSTWTFSATVGAGATTRAIPITWGAVDPRKTKKITSFALGYLTLDEGAIRKSIRVWDNTLSTASLSTPLYDVPEAGTPVSIIMGCDKTVNTCTKIFNNIAMFRGFPYIPAPETAL